MTDLEAHKMAEQITHVCQAIDRALKLMGGSGARNGIKLGLRMAGYNDEAYPQLEKWMVEVGWIRVEGDMVHRIPEAKPIVVDGARVAN